jgi:hypothetical protein
VASNNKSETPLGVSDSSCIEITPRLCVPNVIRPV